MLDPWNHPAIWHAINVHLPIALAVLGLPLVCVVAIIGATHRWLRWSAAVFYVVVTLSAGWAKVTGEKAMGDLPPSLSPAAWAQVEFHERMADKVWMLAGGTALLLLLTNLPHKWARQTFATLAVVFSVVTVGWVGVTAHSGGVAVYEQNLGTVAMRRAHRAAVAAATPPRGHDASTRASAEASAKAISYIREIKPLLSTRCVECHAGADAKGGFDASSVAAMLTGGKKSGPGLIAGRPDDSPLVQYIEGTRQPRMPKGGKPMPQAEVALIRAWIAGGAADDSDGRTVAMTATAPPAPAAAVAAVTPAAPAPAPSPAGGEQVPGDWDPQVNFKADEAVAVRRYVRLKNLPPAPKPPEVDAIAFNPIDRFIISKWPADAQAQAKLPATTRPSTRPSTQPAAQPVPLALCDDSTFARRAYLDLIGMIPSAGEAKNFVNDKDPEKREKLVDALLSRTRDYAGHWVPWWEEALTSNGLHQGGVGTHGNYRKWIFDHFDRNVPYDTMVQALLDPTMPDHPPRYVLNDNHARTVQSSSDVAQVFLGTAIKCASCHSHFDNDEWPQSRAVAFAGFFSDKDLELVRCERKSGQFVRTHFMFDLPSAPTTTPADPVQRRKRLAQLVTDPTNPRFARTLVNRLWKRYVGLGLFEPADDFRADTPPSHPELLDWLADDFVRHGYDVKRTVRLILTSRTYQLRYDPKLEDRFDVAQPRAPRYYRSPSLRRLTAEQMFDSVRVALEQNVPQRRAYQDDNSTPLTRSLGRPAARNEVSTQRPDDTAVVQALELLNGQEYHDRVYKGAMVTNWSLEEKAQEVADALYWSTHGRAASEQEKSAAVAFLRSAPAPASTRPTEVVWLDDAVPPGAATAGQWKLAGPPEQPVFAGKFSHTDDEPSHGIVQHLVRGLKLPVAPKDTLFAYVYLDPERPPKEILLQFHTAATGWNQRAAWGESRIPFAPKENLGPLPGPGEWVRLEFAAEKVGFTRPAVIDGLSFDTAGGRAYWDKSGAMKGPPLHDPAVIGDMLWALITSPEFQYVK